MYLLGIDLGTTGCKSMVFDCNGAILGASYIEYDLIVSDDGIEQDANAWWQNVVTTIKQSLGRSRIQGNEIAALSVSSQGIAFVPVDKAGNALQNAISWLDGRSVDEVATIKREFDSNKIFQSTGKQILPCYVLPQLMWLKAHKPRIYKNTYKILMAHDYIVYKLTGRTITDLSMASGTLAYDIHRQRWNPELLDHYGIDAGMFPELKVLGQVAGTVRPETARELGLSQNTKVVTGAQDQRCASIGAGIDDGIYTMSLGTASAIGALCDRPIIDKTMQVTCCSLDRNHWILEAVVPTAGVALKWFKNTMMPNLSYADLDNMAEASAPLSGGLSFFPHFAVDASGKAKGTFIGLSLQTLQSHMIRAVLEGVAFQMKHHILNMERIGVKGKEIRIFGGGANSSVWCQIIADIIGKNVVVPRTNETANLGAAIIARMGAEGLTDFHEAYLMVGEPQKIFYPNEINVKAYTEAFEQYVRQNELIMQMK